jgi:hypothetical protein
MKLEVQEAILVEEMECGLHPPDGQNLSAELDKAHARVNRIDDEHATEAEQLSRQVVRIFGVLIDLGMLPIQDIPQLPKSAREVLSVVDLILKRLQEALSSGAGSLDYVLDGRHACDFRSFAPLLFRFLFSISPF